MVNGSISKLLLVCVLVSASHAVDRGVADQIDGYLKPYVESSNFSGTVLVTNGNKAEFSKTYGLADRERKIANTKDIRFHIASVSMQFTAAAILRLVDKGALSLDTHVGEYLPSTPGSDKITIRDLLLQRSGLDDINNLPDYDDILQHHQTATSLVARIQGHPLLFEPGTKFLHEEHSAYNLLALIAEKKTGLPFGAAVKQLVLQPLGLHSTVLDDDSNTTGQNIAIGYQPEGVAGLKRALSIHWSAKTGNASVYTTSTDQEKLIDAFFGGRFLGPRLRAEIQNTSPRVGFGWFRSENQRFNQTAYSMNGRAPGYASFVLWLPKQGLKVVVFSNIYSSATTTIGYDIAAIALGLPHATFQPKTLPNPTEGADEEFQFGPDFYQANARLKIIQKQGELFLQWPSADSSPLIPVARDQYIDRAYWEEVRVERDAAGHPSVLHYDKFQGKAVETASRKEPR